VRTSRDVMCVFAASAVVLVLVGSPGVAHGQSCHPGWTCIRVPTAHGDARSVAIHAYPSDNVVNIIVEREYLLLPGNEVITGNIGQYWVQGTITGEHSPPLTGPHAIPTDPVDNMAPHLTGKTTPDFQAEFLIAIPSAACAQDRDIALVTWQQVPPPAVDIITTTNVYTATPPLCIGGSDPSLARLSNSNLRAAWLQNDAAPQDVYYALQTGASWGAPIEVGDSLTDKKSASILVDPGLDELRIAWYENDIPDNLGITTWFGDTTVALYTAIPGSASVVVYHPWLVRHPSNGQVDLFYRSRNNTTGVTAIERQVCPGPCVVKVPTPWSMAAPTVLNSGPGDAGHDYPQSVVSANTGRQFLVYHKKSESGKTAVWFTERCGIAGSWSAPIQLMSPTNGTYWTDFVLSQAAPALAVNETNTWIHVVFTTTAFGDAWWVRKKFDPCP